MSPVVSAALLLLVAGSAIAQESIVAPIPAAPPAPATVEVPPLPERTADGRRFVEVARRCAGVVGPKAARANECTRAGLALSDVGHPAAVVLFAQACLEASELGCQLAELAALVPEAARLPELHQRVALCEIGDDVACGVPIEARHFHAALRHPVLAQGPGADLALRRRLRAPSCGRSGYSSTECAWRGALIEQAWDRRYQATLGAPSLEGPSQGRISVLNRQ